MQLFSRYSMKGYSFIQIGSVSYSFGLQTKTTFRLYSWFRLSVKPNGKTYKAKVVITVPVRTHLEFEFCIANIRSSYAHQGREIVNAKLDEFLVSNNLFVQKWSIKLLNYYVQQGVWKLTRF